MEQKPGVITEDPGKCLPVPSPTNFREVVDVKQMHVCVSVYFSPISYHVYWYRAQPAWTHANVQ